MQTRKESSGLWKVALFVGVLIAGGCVALLMTSGKDGAATSSIQAVDVCHAAAKDRLKAPGTARFPSFSQVDVGIFNQASTFRSTAIPKGSHTITSYVDSQNSFGAMLRSKISCIVDPNGTLLAIEVG